jgi:hypothetical protein
MIGDEMKVSRFERIASIAGDFDSYDKWGSAMSLFFSVAAVLDMTDIDGDVTPEPFARWDYHRPPFTPVPSVETVAARAEEFSEGEYVDDFSYAEISLAAAYVAGEVTQDDLIYAGNVLDRYTAQLRLAGVDY